MENSTQSLFKPRVDDAESDRTLGSSSPSETSLWESHEGDEPPRGRRMSLDRLSFRHNLLDRTVDPLDVILPREEREPSREPSRYSRSTIVRVPQSRSLLMIAQAIGGYYVDFVRKSYCELTDYAAQSFIGDKRHPLPEPNRKKRCASEPIPYRRAMETDDEVQDSITAGQQAARHEGEDGVDLVVKHEGEGEVDVAIKHEGEGDKVDVAIKHEEGEGEVDIAAKHKEEGGLDEVDVAEKHEGEGEVDIAAKHKEEGGLDEVDVAEKHEGEGEVEIAAKHKEEGGLDEVDVAVKHEE